MKMTLSISHQDPRKRRNALADYVKFGEAPDFSLYPEFCDELDDDYEHCRSLAIKLVLLMSHKYGDCLVFQKGTSEQVRLEDDAFSKICRMINDPAVQVRIEAAKSISQFRSVSISYLLATLDKKDELNHSGTFVFGCEDERKDVRLASLESLCQCAKNNSKFAERCIDHIVDMFNDEIEGIRLKAIQCLQEIDNAVLREDQVEVILTVLDSPSMDIREASHRMIANVNISSPRSLRRCIESILYNLSRYPQDKLSIFSCFKSLGQNNAEFVASLVNELLAVHPYLKLPEQSLIDENYMATLILIFNAAYKNPSILSTLESHTFQHQTYIRHTLPNFMPHIEAPKSQQASAIFFVSIFERLGKMLKSDCIHRSKLSLMEMSLQDLKSFGMVEPEFRASTEFYRIVIESILIISRLLSTPGWLESSGSLKMIRRVLEQTFTLLRRYHKLSPIQRCCVQQLRVQALAIELVIFINSCNSSALDLCDDFLEEVRNLESFLSDQPFLDSIALGSLAAKMLDELSELDLPKPGTVARRLEPLFCKTPTILNQINETLTLLIDSQDVDDLQCMKTSSATFSNSLDRSDITHKFTAGLVLALTLDAMIDNITDTDDIRLKVVYPDRLAHIIVPVKSHFRLISTDSRSETSTFRLYTSLNICHTTWSEPGMVHVSIILDYRDNPATSMQIDDDDQIRSSEASQIIEISPSISLKVHPQNTRWLS
uniref:Integrator complex subunit 4 n=1 Tax=Aceria tosichella TaxID=561515 RepID=A0A6G1S7D3_9ACAR